MSPKGNSKKFGRHNLIKYKPGINSEMKTIHVFWLALVVGFGTLQRDVGKKF